MKPDWLAIKQKYVQSGVGLRELAKETGASFHTLAKRSRRESWPLLRRVHADGDRTATLPATRSDNPATPTEPSALSLPERSAALRSRIVSELETDVAQVTKNPPQSLAESEQRQSVIGSVVRSAETVLQWNDKSPIPVIRIGVLAQVTIGPAPGPASLPEPPACLPESALPELTEGSEPE